MTTTITKRYSFEAAHWLPKVPEGHKCHRIHGHNYEVEVTVAGDPGDSGFIIDFFELDKYVLPIIERIDHRTLNDITGLDNPTAELIAKWLWGMIRGVYVRREHYISNVRVYETKDCWADFSFTP